MKKIYLLVLPLFATLVSLAQPSAKDFVISVDGNYFKSKSTETTSETEIKTEDKSLGFSLSIERMLVERFSVGISLARYWDEGGTSSFTHTASELSLTVFEAESNYWMPRVFCKYYLPLTSRFYIVSHIKSGYTKVKQELVESHATRQGLSDTELTVLTETTPSTSSYISGIADLNYLDVEVAPELVYFFAKRWGFSLYAGGLRYEKVSGDLEDSDLTFSFKPKYWRLGVNLTF